MSTHYLKLNDGTLAYDDTGGNGPLVVMLPSLGDVRHEYRFVAGPLARAGYRVVALDMRGHGESSPNWPDYSLAAIGSDILALVDHLQAGPATVVATSYPAGAAVWAAAENPAAVRALVLIGAFVRNAPSSALQKAVIRLLFGGPWQVRAWDLFYKSLYPSRQPDDFARYRQQLRANLSQPGRFAAVKAMIYAPRDDSERRLAQVRSPALVLMGSKDPDFPDPTAEARFIAGALGGEFRILEGAGHYPHAEMPEQALPLLNEFLAKVAQPHAA
ncbi:MAG: alpha/beta hydrolase [Anaerolineae bacterium]